MRELEEDAHVRASYELKYNQNRPRSLTVLPDEPRYGGESWTWAKGRKAKPPQGISPTAAERGLPRLSRGSGLPCACTP